MYFFFFFFSSRRRHTRFDCDWSSDVCSSDLELARIKLRREAWQKNPAINLSEVRRLMLALESAIEGVETIYSKHDELKALQSLDRLIESSEIGRSKVMIEPREPLLIINQAPTQTADADHAPVFRAKD